MPVENALVSAQRNIKNARVMTSERTDITTTKRTQFIAKGLTMKNLYLLAMLALLVSCSMAVRINPDISLEAGIDLSKGLGVYATPDLDLKVSGHIR